ncbi:glutaredoxin [Reinekea blandensis]|uniref:Glutaredoxin domain-containing protein n=1 Tax=Reinekea blandensis MED297 TaxID=314283 RepID=A4BK95_9GAMM|nr:glutaredoxin [Reinekea blandensis]EAR07462.1 hypothetical protein MED297_05084 [Reinekea sp. MED297] [Reinekea blandensis MED297]
MRPVLSESQVHPDVRDRLGGDQAYVTEVQNAISQYPVVVVGMAQNPFVKKARRLLLDKGVGFHYLEYGSYFSKWRERLAIKMWTGFTTFPQVFVAGTLVGGYSDLKKLLSDDSEPLLEQIRTS